MYLITTVANRRKLRTRLRGFYKKCDAIPRPVKITSFHNSARRRSYALKMYFGRRIGYDQMKRCEGKARKCRNTSFDRIRAVGRTKINRCCSPNAPFAKPEALTAERP
jgi:hypothetical protein